MEQDLQEKLAAQEKKIDAIYVSVEKTRKYFLWTMVITIVVIVLPLIAAVALVPWMLSMMTAAYGL